MTHPLARGLIVTGLIGALLLPGCGRSQVSQLGEIAGRGNADRGLSQSENEELCIQQAQSVYRTTDEQNEYEEACHSGWMDKLGTSRWHW